MASKNELESENASLKIRIKELEEAVSSLSGDQSETRAPSVEDATSKSLLADIETLRDVILDRDSQITGLKADLKKAEASTAAIDQVADFLESLPLEQPGVQQLTAKEISRGLLYREIDESALFVRI